MDEIRIAWKIGSATGGGLWAPATDRRRAAPLGWIVAECARYGPGSHWIEERRA